MSVLAVTPAPSRDALEALPVISARGLTMGYGEVQVLQGIDLDVRRGEVCAIVGPNGAGKTTLVEILDGYRIRS